MRNCFAVIFCFFAIHLFGIECEPDEGSKGNSLKVVYNSNKNTAHIVVKKDGRLQYAFFNMLGNEKENADREFRNETGALVFSAYQTRNLPEPYDTSVRSTYYTVYCPDEEKEILYWRCINKE